MMRLGLLTLFGLLACQNGEDPTLSAEVGGALGPENVTDAVAIDPEQRIRVRHILLAWAGARRASPELRRNRTEAWAEANDVVSRLEAGESFGSLAAEISDDASARREGDLGVIMAGQMNPVFEAAAFGLDEGQVSSIVETPFGFHIILREALIEVRIRQVLVQWTDARQSHVERSRDEARLRAQEALDRIVAGESVAEVASTYSDGAAGLRGGDLGFFLTGQMLPEFEEIAFALDPGEVSALVESDLGFHILYREE